MKTFIRYAPGSGGTFISLLVHMLSTQIDVSFDSNSGHAHQDLYSKTHNFDSLAHGDCVNRNPDSFKLFKYYTEELYNAQYPNVQEGIQWFKDNLVFDNSTHHCIRTHARNLNSVLPAVDNVALVNITICESDIDQLCYNFVTKTILTNPNWAVERANDTLPSLKYWYPQIEVTYDQLATAVNDRDIKFLCWVIKFAWKNYWEKYTIYTPPAEFKVFNISWASIFDGTITNQIDQLAKFLNVPLTDTQQHNIVTLVNSWRNKQIPIPFLINISDY